MAKVLFIGGNPKGEREPFSERFVSGRRLRALVRKHGIDASYLDLYETQIQEDRRIVSKKKLHAIDHYRRSGYVPFVVGDVYYHGLLRAKPGIESILHHGPHPAARRRSSWEELDRLIGELAGPSAESGSLPV